jgi:hypothetical protein
MKNFVSKFFDHFCAFGISRNKGKKSPLTFALCVEEGFANKPNCPLGATFSQVWQKQSKAFFAFHAHIHFLW